MNPEESEVILSIQGLSHAFGSNRVLHDINLGIFEGQVVALLGPSGCGKSTLLRAIVGTHPPCQGKVLIAKDGAFIEVLQPGRERGIVYQRYSLFPHMTALENVAYGLMVDQTTIADRVFRRFQWKELRRRHLAEAAEMLDQMRLSKAMYKYPPEMSGGMCQRVAIAQALVMKPSLLLLDEPFGALDEATREELQRVLLEIYHNSLSMIKAGTGSPVTVIIVTHDIEEAIFVSSRVVGISQYWDWRAQGHAGCPGATVIYDKPAPIFLPGAVRDVTLFRDQKHEILETIFSDKNTSKP